MLRRPGQQASRLDRSVEVTVDVDRPARDWVAWAWVTLAAWLRGRGATTAALFLGLICTTYLLACDNVPTGHLDAFQKYLNHRHVFVSRFNEKMALRVPRFSRAERIHFGHWNHSLTSCSRLPEAPLVWVLKTPKAASTTLQDLILELNRRFPSRFVVNTRHVRVDWANLDESTRAYIEALATLERRTVVTAHGYFLDFRAASKPRPVFVGTIRDPLVRLISHYEYLHEGPRSVWSVLRHSSASITEQAPSFDECVAQVIEGNTAVAQRWRCLFWSNIQLRYFCGYSAMCRQGGEAALAVAKQHIDQEFLLVGLVERFADSLLLLERLLPSHFKGLQDAYHNTGRSRVNLRKRAPSASSQASDTAGPGAELRPEVREHLQRELRFETALYAHAARRFEAQFAACGHGGDRGSSPPNATLPRRRRHYR